MTRIERSRRRRGVPAVLFAGLLGATMLMGGCSDPAHSGALLGAGIGAIAGQAAGHNTESTLGGAAIGAGIGYAAGRDYERARRHYDRRGHGHGHGHGHDGYEY